MTDKKQPARRRGRGPLPERRAVKLNEGSRKARKSAARLAAAQVLYQMELNDESAQSALKDFIDHRVGFQLDGDTLVPADTELLTSIVTGVEAQADDLLAMVAGGLDKPVAQFDKLLIKLLMCGIYELLMHNDTDTKIIINDYLNVAHAFYEPGEARLVNAVLDRLAKKLR